VKPVYSKYLKKSEVAAKSLLGLWLFNACHSQQYFSFIDPDIQGKQYLLQVTVKHTSCIEYT